MGECYSHLDRRERTLIKQWRESGLSLREIGRRLGRNHGSISRELKRNLWCGQHYYIRSSQEFYERRLKRRARRFRLKNQTIRTFVVEKLQIGWTPELIAGRLKTTQPDNAVCHEAIYQYIYLEAPELRQYLPRKHAKRRQKFPYRTSGTRIRNRVSIRQRPDDVAARSVPGHWECDAIVGGDRLSSLNVLVERHTRLVNITRLPTKSAKATSRAVIRRLAKHPVPLRLSITYDNGSENVLHEQVNAALSSHSYFCEPYHSWEKGSVEQINGLIRRFFPKGTNFNEITDAEINRIEKLLNNRPRKCLDYRTPYEAYRTARGALAH